MLYRQAVGLLRRVRFYAQPTVATIYRSTTGASSIPTVSNVRIASESSIWNKKPGGIALWIILYSQAAIVLGLNGIVAFSEDDPLESDGKNGTEEASGFRMVEDGSVISNIHTSKWRVFTDNGKKLSLQAKLEEAERYFVLALQEAKEGFGEKDPHVASACNNLAELYRVRKAFGKAEPLYLEAVKILEESFGSEDIRVGAAFHNLGQFYLVQRKLEEAHAYYERALKIKRRVLGHGHPDYADTMYHLGTVMHLEGNESDSESLIRNSIKILEDGGQGESITCLRRLRYLSQIHLKSNRFAEAENVQRKILHVMEVSKGWNSLDTVIAAERLGLTLQSIGSLEEAKELLQKCLDVRKAILPEDHIQIGANMLHIGRLAILNSKKVDISEADVELDKAESLLNNSVRIARKVLDGPPQKRRNIKDEHAALVILLQSFTALGILEIAKHELRTPSGDNCWSVSRAEHAFRQCVAAFREAAQSEHLRLICSSPDVKAEYLSCLKHLMSLVSETRDGTPQTTLQELKDEIKSVEIALSRSKNY